jgi:hypothetical protein
MHRAEDLEAAGAEFVCIWPEELVAYLKPGTHCSLGVCSLPSAAPATAPVIARVPDEPGAVRRLRRRQAAADLAASLDGSPVAEAECECADRECGGACRSTDDPLLRKVLAVLGSQLSAERLSARTEESVQNAHQQLTPTAAPNGGRFPPHKEDR